ncbi:cell division initiation protein [Desulfonispora thiosulfatigenes DSM 11270]|uniref:Cell division initiation protein n=1 Tax=Desulfonispora thiosulfatigenes DSM 11270 TaxID=656914 RepID=A0A1W1VMT2_DESTI|nr:DivIVA domain-containing protein [Desulfonispora thiosulfatigenes]SMB94264.1 cell division initiation protein [Desulfonispora thiosulfatigenes DSM 11270]
MLTPLDIHNKEFKRSLRGYDVDEVDEFLDEVIKDYEKTYKDNLDLKDKIEKTQGDINRYKDLEETLHNTLVLAQKTAEEVRINAHKEAELIIQKAQKDAENIISGANQKIIDIKVEYKQFQNNVQQFKAQFKSFLLTQLELVEEEKAKESEMYGENIVLSNAE